MSYMDPPPFDAGDESWEQRRERHERETREREERQRAEAEMREKERVDELLASSAWASDTRSLEERIEDGVEPVCYRIDRMALCGGNTNVFAPFKTGKTVLMANLARSLADETPFLDEFEVEPFDGMIAYLNRELLEEQWTEWMKAQGIEHMDRILPLHLRGRSAYPQDEEHEEVFTALFKREGVRVVIDDTLSTSLLPGTDPNKGGVASSFTSAWDRIKRNSGVTDLFLPSHTGYVTRWDKGGLPLGLHTRGHSTFMDWADSNLQYVAGRNDVRYLSGTGRLREDLPPTALAFDPETMHLTVTEGGEAAPTLAEAMRKGSRGGRSKEQVKSDMITLLKRSGKRGEELSKSAIEKSVVGDSNLKREVLDKLIDKGRVTVRVGPRGAHLCRWVG